MPFLSNSRSKYLNLYLTVLKAQQKGALVFTAVSGFCFGSFWTAGMGSIILQKTHKSWRNLTASAAAGWGWGEGWDLVILASAGRLQPHLRVQSHSTGSNLRVEEEPKGDRCAFKWSVWATWPQSVQDNQEEVIVMGSSVVRTEILNAFLVTVFTSKAGQKGRSK